MIERAYTCGQMSDLCGGALSAESIRAACYRSSENHPLPHIRSGEKRPVIKIRPSVFQEWYEEEERMQVSR